MLNELFAREILETSIALGILQEMNGGVVIYHEASKEDPENLPAGWYIDDKNYTTFSIATDPEAIRELKPCLVEAGYQYEEREAFWENILGNTAPKLRLPIRAFLPRPVFAERKRNFSAVSCSVLKRIPLPNFSATSSRKM